MSMSRSRTSPGHGQGLHLVDQLKSVTLYNKCAYEFQVEAKFEASLSNRKNTICASPFFSIHLFHKIVSREKQQATSNMQQYSCYYYLAGAALVMAFVPGGKLCK